MTKSKETSLYRLILNTSFWNPLAGVTEMGKALKKKRPAFPALCKIDQEIIRIIATRRFSHHKDLERILNGLPTGYNLYRRTRHLKNVGLVESLIGDGEISLGYRLTRKGIELAKKSAFASDGVLQSRPVFRTQFDHDRIVNEAREILSASPIIRDFVSEVELRSRFGREWRISQNKSERDWKVPDALFTLRTTNGVMTTALEVELSQKAKARYAKIVQALLTSKKFHLVFILCKTERLMHLIRNEVIEARTSNPVVRASNRSNGIYFCTLANLRELGLDAPWEGENSRFSIKDIMLKLGLKLAPEGKPQVSLL